MWKNPTVTGAEQRVSGWLSGFRTFILRGNVVDLAVGIVIGAAFTTVVNGFVGDVITPLIPVPGGSISTWKWPVPYNHSAFLNIGTFINAVITLPDSGFRYILLCRAAGERPDGPLQARGSGGASRHARLPVLPEQHSTYGYALRLLHISAATTQSNPGTCAANTCGTKDLVV